jgi:protein SCO1/2
MFQFHAFLLLVALGAPLKPLSLVALLATCFVATSADAATHESSAYPWQLKLTDQDGASFQLSDFEGKTLLLGFIFTHCPSACPMQTARMTRVQELLPDAIKARSAFASVSIDPKRDSVAKLQAFARQYRAKVGHWRFGVTQNEAALAQLLEQLDVKIVRNEDGSINHKMVLLLIDAKGRVVQRYVGDRFDEARVVREIAAVDRLFSK